MPNSNADINLRNAEVCVVKAGSKRAEENNWRMQMKYKVYADTEHGCENDSIAVREDGLETIAFGGIPDAYEHINQFYWDRPGKYPTKGRLLFEGEYEQTEADKLWEPYP